MGLDDFTEEDDEVENSDVDSKIKTRKKLKNVNLPEEFWIHLIHTDPSWAGVAASYTDDTSAKAIASKMQEAVDGELNKPVSPELEQDIRHEINMIVEDLD